VRRCTRAVVGEVPETGPARGRYGTTVVFRAVGRRDARATGTLVLERGRWQLTRVDP
jgi:hypothetical protein